jgi:hypothetical protein
MLPLRSKIVNRKKLDKEAKKVWALEKGGRRKKCLYPDPRSGNCWA